VLPGVTVEAASPALIEKMRIATTDSDGRFRIIDLRPGEYAVTFTLTGFRTLRREGIQLTTGVHGDRERRHVRWGVEETITVTGAANRLLFQVGGVFLGGTHRRKLGDEEDHNIAVFDRLANYWYGSPDRTLIAFV
jgi:hypothetical protein